MSEQINNNFQINELRSADGDDHPIFATVDAAVSAAVKAQLVFHEHGLELRRAVIKAIRKTSIANAERWGHMAVEETKMGRAEDKTQKNILCAKRTPGVKVTHLCLSALQPVMASPNLHIL